MRVKPAGKLVILILVAGIAVGLWRWYKGRGGTLPTLSAGQTAQNGVPPAASAGNGGVDFPGGGGTSGGGGGGNLVLITSATKKGWLENQADKFSQQGHGKITLRYYETRAAMQAILNGKEKPVLWAPSSPIWAQRLGEAWPQFHGGESSPVSLSDPASFRVYLRSPLVFLTTKERAQYLRPLLGGSDPWGLLRELSLGKKTVPGMGGKFRFAHADPLNANSGFLTLGMILGDYARRHGGDPAQVANSPAFIQYLTELERGLIYDEPVRGGSSAVYKAFLDDPSRYGVITTYESNALEGAASYPDIAVIYPNPTAVSEQAVAVMNGTWVSPEQKQTAAAFLDFLAQPDSIKEGVATHFRPGPNLGSGASLDGELAQYASQGFRTDFTPAQLPTYAALNDAASQWRVHVAHLPVSGTR